MTISNPEKIGRYQILERVGKGGMGVLFRGVDSVLDREVAIKLMLLDFSSDADEMRPRFYREAKAVAKLQHPNIVTVFEFAEEQGTPYIVMEFLRGMSLAERMTSAVPLTLDDKLNIVAQLSSALSYAHEQGVVHRDVKPANVFILPDGTVKLLDFGVAKLTTSTLTRQGDVLGSASYMSPEQVAGAESVDGRADIFAAGVVLYELLAGRRPYEADSPTATVVKILYEEPTPLEQVTTGLPPQLVAAVKKALAKNPADRFATAGDFARELQIIRRSLPPPGSAVSGFDETRFASETEMKAIQQELAKARTAPAAAAAAAAAPVSAPASGPRWIVPAVIGALVIAGIAGAVMFMGGTPETAPTAASGSATAGAAPAAAPSAFTSMKITSEPAGAAIALNGKATNQTTPALIDVPGDGPYRMRLSLKGFADQEITLGAGDLKRGSASVVLKASEAARIPVSILSAYPVQVFEGSRSISGESDSHELSIAAGANLRIVASKYGLEAPVKVEGRQVKYQAPPLGYLTVRSTRETCSVMIGARNLGEPPISKMPIVSGQHRVDMVCPNGQNPPGQFVTVPANAEVVARIN